MEGVCCDAMRDPMTNVISFLGETFYEQDEEDTKVVTSVGVDDYRHLRATCKFFLECWDHALFLEVPIKALLVHSSALNPGSCNRLFPWSAPPSLVKTALQGVTVPKGESASEEQVVVKQEGALLWITGQAGFLHMTSGTEGEEEARPSWGNGLAASVHTPPTQVLSLVMGAGQQLDEAENGGMSPDTVAAVILQCQATGRSPPDSDRPSAWHEPMIAQMRISDIPGWTQMGDAEFPQGYPWMTVVALENLPALTDIGRAQLRGFNSLHTAVVKNLPELVNIRDGFLDSCPNLTSLDFSDLPKLNTIGMYFLKGCGLDSVVFSGLPRLRTLGHQAFTECRKIKCATVKDLPLLESFGMYLFEEVLMLEEVHFSNLPQLRQADMFWLRKTSLVQLSISDLPQFEVIPWASFGKNPVLQRVELKNLPKLNKIDGRFLFQCPLLAELHFAAVPLLAELGDDSLGLEGEWRDIPETSTGLVEVTTVPHSRPPPFDQFICMLQEAIERRVTMIQEARNKEGGEEVASSEDSDDWE